MATPFWVPPPLPFTILYPPLPPLLIAPTAPSIFPTSLKPSQLPSRITAQPITNSKRSSKMFLVESLLPSVAEKRTPPPSV
ncbi:unnamed protein product [Toxocara canis]|uniref:Ovule protein n=1 Tax=Toxocara canis TaxID=6265 RepID=A0A183V4U0_TOXCA|nr:unnamed protein product [Toxocara canis]